MGLQAVLPALWENRLVLLNSFFEVSKGVFGRQLYI
jgi:hypothetical protein